VFKPPLTQTWYFLCSRCNGLLQNYSVFLSHVMTNLGYKHKSYPVGTHLPQSCVFHRVNSTKIGHAMGLKKKKGVIPAFWDVMLFHQTSTSQHFKGICRLIFKGSRSTKNINWSQVVRINRHGLTGGC